MFWDLTTTHAGKIAPKFKKFKLKKAYIGMVVYTITQR